jgi:hypothetical protein
MMRDVDHFTYDAAMTDANRASLHRQPRVTIEAASELIYVDIPTLREWARLGDLVIEQRGDMEVVELEVVTALASRHRAAKRGSFHDRLREGTATPPSSDLVSVVDLQNLARDRDRR